MEFSLYLLVLQFFNVYQFWYQNVYRLCLTLSYAKYLVVRPLMFDLIRPLRSRLDPHFCYNMVTTRLTVFFISASKQLKYPAIYHLFTQLFTLKCTTPMNWVRLFITYAYSSLFKDTGFIQN